MTDEPILGVAPAEPLEATPPELEAPTPAPDDELTRVALNRDGKKVLAKVLEVEGEVVRALRGVPADEPDAWRWTDAEVEAIMPALEGLAERYGVAAHINEHAPQAGAGIAIAMHVNRSLAAERAWRESHGDTPTTEEPDVGPIAEPAEPAPERAGGPGPSGAQPGAGLGPAELARVSDHLGSDGLRGGR